MGLEAIALFLLFAWTPIFLHFTRTWRRRANPISLAIVTLVMFAAYVATVPAWLRAGLARDVVLWVVLGLDTAVCLHFYLAFVWAKRKFKSDRN